MSLKTPRGPRRLLLFVLAFEATIGTLVEPFHTTQVKVLVECVRVARTSRILQKVLFCRWMTHHLVLRVLDELLQDGLRMVCARVGRVRFLHILLSTLLTSALFDQQVSFHLAILEFDQTFEL